MVCISNYSCQLCSLLEHNDQSLGHESCGCTFTNTYVFNQDGAGRTGACSVVQMGQCRQDRCRQGSAGEVVQAELVSESFSLPPPFLPTSFLPLQGSGNAAVLPLELRGGSLQGTDHYRHCISNPKHFPLFLFENANLETLVCSSKGSSIVLPVITAPSHLVLTLWWHSHF